MANLFKYLNILPFKYMQYGCVWNIIDITLYHHSIDIRSNTLFSNDLKCWWGMGGGGGGGAKERNYKTLRH